MAPDLWNRLRDHVKKGSLKDLKHKEGAGTLYVVAKGREHSWAGEYLPCKGQMANGHPFWMKAGGNYWLYACQDGTWGIGGKDVRTCKFRSKKAFVYSVPHNGKTPDKVRGSWTWLDDTTGQWIQDKTVKIYRNVPPLLNVSIPEGQSGKAGVYTLVSGLAPNGFPLWRSRTGGDGFTWWMYSGTTGTWCIGGDDVKEKNFECSSGFIFSKPHNNSMPHQCSGVWTRLDEVAENWVEDQQIKVFGTIPEKLHIALPHGPHLVEGEYRLIAGSTANGGPLWKNVGKDYWMYSCKDGTWGIGGLDVKEKNFDGRAGFVFSGPHHGEMPDKMNGTWMRYMVGGSWNFLQSLTHNAVDVLTKGAASKSLGQQKFQDDPSIQVFSDVPTELYVALPGGPDFCDGRYTLQLGTAANDEPVWKKVGSDFWLYSCTDGTWAIGAVDVSLKKFQCQSGFVFSTPHGGALPDKTTGYWSRWHDTERRWVEDPSIGVFREVPAKLHVALPYGPHECTGEYLQVPAAVANGQPLWRQVGGDCWLASLPDGTWGICGGDVAEGGFISCAAFVHSIAHHGQMPHQLAGLWTRTQGKEWIADPHIAVFGNVPQTLHIALSDGTALPNIAGRYSMVTDETANGQPVWQKQMDSSFGKKSFWLFSCVDGTWGIGGDDVRQNGWVDQSAYVYSGPHEGAMPCKMTGTWARFSPEQNTWVPDNGIAAFSDVSEEVHVALPGELKPVSGRYLIVFGTSTNGQPMWKKVDGDYWLYSCKDGTWGIGGLDVKQKSFDCSAGFIYSVPHDGIMPDKLTNPWRRWCPEQGKLLKDSSIAVFAAAPQVLHVVIPSPGLEALRGDYELILGEAANGMPVWRKVGGDYWFFSCIDSSWGIGGTDVKEKKFKCSLSFIYSAVHNGEMPHRMEGSWNRWDDLEDPDICIKSRDHRMLTLPEMSPALPEVE